MCDSQRSNLSSVFCLCASLILVSCGGGGGSGGGASSSQNPAPPPTPATLESVTLSPSALPDGLVEGFERQLTARAVFSDNRTPNVTQDATWETSDSTVATVSSGGLVTAVAAGSATITATYNNEVGRLSLKVNAATLSRLEVTQPSSDALPVGVKRQFVATGVFSNNQKKNLTGQVTWASSMPEVLYFSSETNGLGIAQTVGSADVTASMMSVTSDALTVTTKSLGSGNPGVGDGGRIEVTPADLPTLPANLPVQLRATYVIPDRQPSDVTRTITWESEDTNIGTVDENGLFTGLRLGTVKVTARDSTKDISGELTISVDNRKLERVRLEPESIPVLPVGVRFRVKVLADFESGEILDITNAMVATSSNPDAIVALLPEDEPGVGYLYAAGAGSSTVTAVLPNTTIRFEGEITAAEATLQSLRLSPAMPAELPVGLEQPFNAIGGFSVTGVQDTQEFDITSQVTFSSSAPAIATISNAAGSFGLANAVAVGTSNITASVPDSIVSNTVQLTVGNAILLSLTGVPPGNKTIPLSAGVLQFKTNGEFSDGTVKDMTNEVNYYSDDTKVGKFEHDKPGLLFLENTGFTAVVIFKDIATIAPLVTVNSLTPDSVAITGPENVNLAVLPKSSTVQLTATATYSDATTADITLGCAWTSTNADLGTFGSTPGLLTTKAAGTFDVRCFNSGTNYEQSVTIDDGVTLTAGVWTATGTDSNGATYDVCFNVSADLTKITPNGSTCDNGASFVATITGTNPVCQANILNADDDDISTLKVLSQQFFDAFAETSYFGTFDTSTSFSGNARRFDRGTQVECKADFTATPD